MKLKTVAISAIICCGASGLAFAQGNPLVNLSPYVGIGAGQSDFDVSNRDWGLGGVDDDTDTAWRIFAGARLHPFIGAEIGYIDFGRTTGELGGKAKAKGVDLVALGILPLAVGQHQFDAFIKAGGYWWDAKIRGTRVGDDLNGGDSFDYTYGAGVQYHFSNFGVRAEWQRYNDVFKRVDTDVVMGSVMFRF